MADEQESIASPELAQPAIAPKDVDLTAEEYRELPQDVEAPDSEPAADDGEDPAPDAEAVEFVTLERNGKQYQVPKDLEGEFLMNADYTKKTQTVAERVKELDIREEQIAQQAQVTDDELDARANLKGINARLAEYGKLTQQDWAAHSDNDFVGTQNAWLDYQMLKDQKAELDAKIGQATTQRTEKAKQDLANRVQDTIAFAQKEIPGWKPELTDKLVKFAIDDMGVPEEALKSNWSPTFYKLLHRAHIGTLTLQKQAAPKPAAQPIAPLATVRAAASPSVNRSLTQLADGDDMEAYAKARADGRRR